MQGASSTPTREGFPWVIDLFPPVPEPLAELERRRVELAAAPDDPARIHPFAQAQLIVGLYEPTPQHEPDLHLREASDSYARLLDRISGEAYARSDYVVFEAALVALLLGDEAAFKDKSLRLLREYPSSDTDPYIYLAFGEVLLEQQQVDNGIKLLERAEEFQQPHVRAYASHALAWAHLSTQPPQPRRALAHFVEVIKISKTLQSTQPDAATALRTSARRGLVGPYAEVGNPRKATVFFEQIGTGPDEEDMVDEMLSLLAQTQRASP